MSPVSAACALVGCRALIVKPVGWVATLPLVAAVSEAGALAF